MRALYRERRDVLIGGLARGRLGRAVPGRLDVRLGADPAAFRQLGSVEFSKLLLERAKVAVSPGLGFGEHGDGLRAHRAGREQAPDPPGGAQHPRRSCRPDPTLRARDAISTVGSAHPSAGRSELGMTQPLSVAVAGLGTVGGGVLKLLRDNADVVAARAGRPIAVTAVSARDRTRDRGVSLSRPALVRRPGGAGRRSRQSTWWSS